MIICDMTKCRSSVALERHFSVQYDSDPLFSCPHIPSVTVAVFAGPDANVGFVGFAGRALEGNMVTMTEIIISQHGGIVFM